jgi:hypothetical protein
MSLLFLMLAFCTPAYSPQFPTAGEKSEGVLGSDTAEVKAALHSGSLVKSRADNEYFWTPNRHPEGAASTAFWSFGDKVLTSQESLKIKIQIGESSGLGVFLTLAVPKSGGQASIDKAIKLLTDATNDNVGVTMAYTSFKPCRGKARCVKTCKDDKGKEYCCEFRCVSSTSEVQ